LIKLKTTIYFLLKRILNHKIPINIFFPSKKKILKPRLNGFPERQKIDPKSPI
jgi:hypothetical protein